MPKIRKRRAYGRPYRRAPQKRRVFSDSQGEGCIKITIGRSRIIVWNNCGRDITISAGEGLKLAVTSRVRYELDFGSATAIFAEPVNQRGAAKEDEGPRPEDYDWV